MKRIFFAEDNEDNADIIGEMMRRCGYDVLRAGTGDELLELLEEAIPDLILLDIEMPGLDGRELLQILRSDKRFRHLPILAMSGGVGGNRDGYVSLGFNDFLPKPFSMAALRSLLASHLQPTTCSK